jgi:hypothetical protein
MTQDAYDYYDDERELYFWRDESTDGGGVVYSRPYTDEEKVAKAKRQQLDDLRAEAGTAITYLDDRLVLSLAYLEKPEPTAEETAEVIRVLCDLAAYSAGTLKRLIVVLGDLTGRPL